MGNINDVLIKMSPILNAKQIRLLFLINIICCLFINEWFKTETKAMDCLRLLKALRMQCFDTFTQVLVLKIF